MVWRGWQERGGRKTRAIGQQSRAHESQHGSALQTAAFGNGEHPLDKQPARLGLCALRATPPDDRIAESPLGGVVGGFDSPAADETPQSLIQGQQMSPGFRPAATISQDTLR